MDNRSAEKRDLSGSIPQTLFGVKRLVIMALTSKNKKMKLTKVGFNIWDDYWDDVYVPEGEI